MSLLLPPQLADVNDLQHACAARQIDIVIIGAMAYRMFIRDVDRETEDIDIAVAIDLEELDSFYALLEGLGWKRSPRHEHRWRTSRGSLLDLLPAGPALRAKGAIEWPESGLTMSLTGFEHVFEKNVEVQVGPNLRCKVVPPPVLLLLKMASHLDEPYARTKDLLDIRRLLRLYERDSDRLFCDEVFQAELADFQLAGAFLLGLDVSRIATVADRELITRFVRFVAGRFRDGQPLDIDGRETEEFRAQVGAFQKGLA
jgi:predicted nucleotidyltransferase